MGALTPQMRLKLAEAMAREDAAHAYRESLEKSLNLLAALDDADGVVGSRSEGKKPRGKRKPKVLPPTPEEEARVSETTKAAVDRMLEREGLRVVRS